MGNKYNKKPIMFQISDTGCWECISHYRISGYPIKAIDMKETRISRLVLSDKLGRQIKDGYFACHTCDNPSCINPDHIFEGSRSDNMKDMYEKGRGYKQKTFKAISPEGIEYTSNNQTEFANKHNLNQDKISLCLLGKRNTHKRWKFKLN